MVLEKTLESPLDCKEIQPVHPKGYQSWAFIGKTDAKKREREREKKQKQKQKQKKNLMLKLKLQYFGHLMGRVESLEKTLMLGGIGGRRRRG